MTLHEHIRRYLEFVERADRLFDSVAQAHPELMACKPGCDDCCSVYFELSLLEAFYISGMFQAELWASARERVLQRADKVAPLFEEAKILLERIAQESSKDEEQLHEAASRFTIQCPLNEDQGCMLYEHRPVTCRTYGTPQKIGGRIVSCPRTGFRQGNRYVTVDVNKIQQTLSEYSRDFLKDLVGVSLSETPRAAFFDACGLANEFRPGFLPFSETGIGVKKKKRTGNEGWTGRVRSVDVGERLRLVPYWERSFAASDRINVIIDPGPSFGSGDHPSTVMALELLEAAVKKLGRQIPSPTLVDAGTGTGVLSIAGKALGCGFTVGFDIDSAAVFTARRNLRLNGMARDEVTPDRSVDLFVGGADSIKGLFDIVAANLAAPTLIRLRHGLFELVGTFLILSGIAEVMEDAVVTAYRSANLHLVNQEKKDGWSAALFRRGR